MVDSDSLENLIDEEENLETDEDGFCVDCSKKPVNHEDIVMKCPDCGKTHPIF